MSAPQFTLTPAVLKSLQSAWRVQLSPDLVDDLEDIARLVIMVRSFLDISVSAKVLTSTRKEIRAGRKRHAAIARTAEQLVQLLQGDRQAKKPMGLADLLAAYSFGKAIERAVPLLRDIAELASREYRPVEELVTPKSGRRRGRPHSLDGWTLFILEAMGIYKKATGKDATASWSEHKGAQDSPFLRGLLKLHEALPANVQVRATSFLGNRTNYLLRGMRARTKLAKSRRSGK